MPPTNSLVGIQWLNYNSLRSYPLADGATGLDTTGTFELPNDLIVDLIFPIGQPASYNPNLFHISEVAIFGQGVVIKIGYDDNSVTVGSLSVSTTHVQNQAYFVHGVGEFEDSVGIMTVGSLANTLENAGLYSFDTDGGRIHPLCIRPDIRGVRGISALNGEDASDPLQGVVHLVAGANMRITPVEVDPNTNLVVPAGVAYNGFRLDALDATDLEETCECTNERQLPPPIRRINGQPPSADGNFLFQGTTCLQVTPGENGIKLDDVCSEPCCGNEEIDRLAEDQDNLNVDLRTMYNLIIRLETSLAQMLSLARAIEATGFILP